MGMAMVRVIFVSFATFSPAGGLILMTVPAVEVDSSVTIITLSPEKPRLPRVVRAVD
jgi:hypothetical protein